MINMKINSYENNLKNNYISENTQEPCNQSFVPIYDNYNLENDNYTYKINQTDIISFPPIKNEQNIQIQQNQKSGNQILSISSSSNSI